MIKVKSTVEPPVRNTVEAKTGLKPLIIEPVKMKCFFKTKE